MASDFYHERKVKTRKAHKCEGCCDKFPPGTEMAYVTGVFEGEFFYAYLCVECRDYMQANPWEFEDGWSLGDVGEARKGIDK